jgi:hypothetical protein
MRKQCYAFICVVVTILLIGCYTASYDISQKQKDLTRIEDHVIAGKEVIFLPKHSKLQSYGYFDCYRKPDDIHARSFSYEELANKRGIINGVFVDYGMIKSERWWLIKVAPPAGTPALSFDVWYLERFYEGNVWSD